MLHETELKDMIRKDDWMMEVPRAARKLDLPQSMIGAGFVRNKIWDTLSGNEFRTDLISDIDLVYFNPDNLDKAQEKEYDKILEGIMPCGKWSVKNQARMHKIHDDPPYSSAFEGLGYWIETATCIAVNLNTNDEIEVYAPHGLEDAFNFKLKPIPKFSGNNLHVFEKRIKTKPWLKEWPQLSVEI